jgi:hypothetical protein
MAVPDSSWSEVNVPHSWMTHLSASEFAAAVPPKHEAAAKIQLARTAFIVLSDKRTMNITQ